MKCCSSLQFYAWERRGSLARGTLHPARFSKVKLLRSEWTTNRTRTSGDAKATIVAIQIQRFVARRTYEATLDDVPGLFDDRHCHRLAGAGPPRTTAHSLPDRSGPGYHQLDVVHMHRRACMVPPKCLQSLLYTKPPTRSQRVTVGGPGTPEQRGRHHDRWHTLSLLSSTGDSPMPTEEA